MWDDCSAECQWRDRKISPGMPAVIALGYHLMGGLAFFLWR